MHRYNQLRLSLVAGRAVAALRFLSLLRSLLAPSALPSVYSAEARGCEEVGQVCQRALEREGFGRLDAYTQVGAQL